MDEKRLIMKKDNIKEDKFLKFLRSCWLWFSAVTILAILFSLLILTCLIFINLYDIEYSSMVMLKISLIVGIPLSAWLLFDLILVFIKISNLFNKNGNRKERGQGEEVKRGKSRKS